MWISNTATTAMMLPIVDAVADAINEKPSNARCEAAGSPTGKEKDDSPHESEQEDEFNEEDADLPFNQRTFTSINQALPKLRNILTTYKAIREDFIVYLSTFGGLIHERQTPPPCSWILR